MACNLENDCSTSGIINYLPEKLPENAGLFQRETSSCKVGCIFSPIDGLTFWLAQCLQSSFHYHLLKMYNLDILHVKGQECL